MNTILKICEHLKGFGDYIVADGMLRDGYVDVLVLLTIAALGSIVAMLAERILR